MTQHDQPELDDPALKAALRHTFAGERAPRHLRERIVAQMVAGEAEPSTSRDKSWRRRIPLGENPRRILAAACIAVAAVGVAAYQVKQHLFPPRLQYTGPTARTETVIPKSFAMEMIRTHESCAKLPDHHLVAANDLVKLRDALTTRAKVQVAVVSFQGWQFKGAGLCKVGEVTGAHLMYAKPNGQSVSIFELPADALYAAPEGATYAQTVEGHAISGFRAGAGVYCVVGSAGDGAPSMPEITQMRGLLQAALPPVDCDMGGGATVAKM